MRFRGLPKRTLLATGAATGGWKEAVRFSRPSKTHFACNWSCNWRVGGSSAFSRPSKTHGGGGGGEAGGGGGRVRFAGLPKCTGGGEEGGGGEGGEKRGQGEVRFAGPPKCTGRGETPRPREALGFRVRVYAQC